MARDPLGDFERLFNDDIAEELSKSDQLTDRLVATVQLGIDAVEDIILNGEPTAQISALSKILPLATRVAEKRQDAELSRVVETCRAMFLEIFPDRASIEDLNADIDAEFEIPVFEDGEQQPEAHTHDPTIPDA